MTDDDAGAGDGEVTGDGDVTGDGATPGLEAATVTVTAAAREVIAAVEADVDEGVAVVLNDGCCDGMGPLAVRESMVGHADVRLGTDGGVDVYTPPNRAELRRGYAVVVDVVDAVGGEGAFSLEVPRGVRLVADERRTGT